MSSLRFVERFAAAMVGLIGAASGAVATPDDLPPDVLLIAHTVQANRTLLRHLSRYTCLETMTRGERARDARIKVKDVVQLDVGIANGEEVYSWPGDPAFSSKDLTGLVGHGMLASGLFRTFVNGLFVRDSAIIKAAGEQSLDGERTFHFTYSAQSLANAWQVNWLGASGSVGESGEFWVDASNLTLKRLRVEARDIPPNLPLQSIVVDMRYRTLDSEDGMILLPQSARLDALEANGMHVRETVDFSHCLTFAAESRLTSGAPSAEANLVAAVGRYEAQREILPGGMTLEVSLESQTQAKRAAVGDRVQAILRKRVTTPGGETIPEGAVLYGRVRLFEPVDDAGPGTFLVGIEFDQLKWEGHAASFFARMVGYQPLPGITDSLSQHRMEHSLLGGRGAVTQNSTTTETPAFIPGAAAFFLQPPLTALPNGFQMTWRTEAIGRGTKPGVWRLAASYPAGKMIY